VRSRGCTRPGNGFENHPTTRCAVSRSDVYARGSCFAPELPYALCVTARHVSPNSLSEGLRARGVVCCVVEPGVSSTSSAFVVPMAQAVVSRWRERPMRAFGFRRLDCAVWRQGTRLRHWTPGRLGDGGLVERPSTLCRRQAELRRWRDMHKYREGGQRESANPAAALRLSSTTISAERPLGRRGPYCKPRFLCVCG
jgi:hypothetical protein